MNKNLITEVSHISALAALAITFCVAAPEAWTQVSSKPQTHYKVIDTGSFGGPNSHMTMGCSLDSRTLPSQILMHRRMSAGMAIASSHTRFDGAMANSPNSV